MCRNWELTGQCEFSEYVTFSHPIENLSIFIYSLSIGVSTNIYWLPPIFLTFISKISTSSSHPFDTLLELSISYQALTKPIF